MMTRNLFLACALMAAVALATVRALAPGCEGNFCLGSNFKTGAGQDSARAGEVPGAGRKLLGVTAQVSAPEAASETWLSTQDSRSSWSEPMSPEQQGEEPLAEQPAITTDDWQHRQTVRARRTARNDTRIEALGRDEKPQLTYKERQAQAAAAAKAAKAWDSLVETALKEPDDELRGEAINGVGLHRNADAVAVLNEVAALDPAPDNRLQAVQQLWYSAADGLDSNGMIRSTLETARDDPDEAIAKMAERALADLQALEETRQLN